MASVTRRTTISRAARREDLSRRLLGVVEELLADGGTFTELSIATLIERAGLARSTFYVYFEDRSALLAALGDTVFDDLAEAAGAWGEMPAAPSRADVRAAVGRIADAYLRHRVVVVAIAEASAYDAAASEQHEALLERQTAALVAGIRTGVEAGTIRAGIDVERVAAWVVWMTDRGMRELMPGAKARARRRLLDALTDVVVATLYAESG